jgi:hypothetical protein
MKKYLLILIIFGSCIKTYGQSISLLDLANLTSLKSNQVDDYFINGRIFKLQYGEQVNDFLVKHYQVISKTNKQETVLTGTGFKTSSGAILYTVSYVTNDPQNIINLINQTKSVALKLTFQGADETNNIYIYDSFLYHVVFRLTFNQTSGTVDITQKIVFAQ